MKKKKCIACNHLNNDHDHLYGNWHVGFGIGPTIDNIRPIFKDVRITFMIGG